METRFIKRPGDRAAWLAARRPYYGQSQVGAIFNLSPWEAPIDLFLEKTGRRVREDAPTDAMLLGIELEGYAARRYAEKTGRTVRNYGYMVVRGHALADVDRLVVPDGEKVASHHAEIRAAGILECKTARDEWRDEVPLHYQLQAQGYCELLDLPWCDFSVVFKNTSAHRCPADPGWEFLRVERDRAVGARIMREIEAFAELVARDEPPPVNGLADARALFPNARPESRIDATPELLGLVRDLREKEARRKALEEEADALKGKIAAAMGDAEALMDGKAKLCTFKCPKPTERIDYKAALVQVGEEFHLDPARVGQIVHANGTVVEGARRFLLCAERRA